eukprot:14749892-Alexandrium_andersonii.AAC.1
MSHQGYSLDAARAFPGLGRFACRRGRGRSDCAGQLEERRGSVRVGGCGERHRERLACFLRR